MNKLFRTFKSTLWYLVVMWAGVAYFLYSPLPDWYWYLGMFIYALAVWLLISKVRQILRF